MRMAIQTAIWTSLHPAAQARQGRRPVLYDCLEERGHDFAPAGNSKRMLHFFHCGMHGRFGQLAFAVFYFGVTNT